MELFHQIPDKFVLLSSKRGVYRQVKAYTRAGRVYAGYGSGFIQLIERGNTSCPDVTWYESDVPMKVGTMGRMFLKAENEVVDFRTTTHKEAAAA